MSSVLGSQGLVLATAMVVSSTVLFLTFSRQKTCFTPPQLSRNHDSQQAQEKILRSCLSSGDKKRERKKKKVKFAENVKEPSGNGEEFRNQMKKRNRGVVERNCRNAIPGIQRMPPNRVALYNGILKDRVYRMECSH